MDAEFWHSKWDANQIGFHQPDAHPELIKHWQSLGAKPGDSVFVPLCGKSRDLLWLAEAGYQVIGSELSAVAAADFFKESSLSVEVEEYPRHTVFTGGSISIHCGDYFDLLAADLGPIDAVYDRAALIALPPTMRPTYRTQLERLGPGAPILLITLGYDQSIMDGPPFSVEDDEVRTLFSDRHQIDTISSIDALDQEPKFAQRGLTALTENTYRIL